MSAIKILSGLSLLVFLSGCATEMAFHDEKQKITPETKSIFLMKVTLKNDFMPSFQPKLTAVNLEKDKNVSSNNNHRDILSFAMDNKGISKIGEASEGNSFLVRMEVKDGKYKLTNLDSQARKVIILTSYSTPINSELNVSGNGIFYLGHLTGTIRKRNSGESMAGLVVPLLDQTVGGAIGGTFDVKIEDNFTADEEEFKNKFPILRDVKITKSLLNLPIKSK